MNPLGSRSSWPRSRSGWASIRVPSHTSRRPTHRGSTERWGLGLLSERALTFRQGLHEEGQRNSEAVRLETKSADERLSSPEGYCQTTCETGRQLGPVWFQMMSLSATQPNC